MKHKHLFLILPIIILIGIIINIFFLLSHLSYSQQSNSPICILPQGFQAGQNYWLLNNNNYLYPSADNWNVVIGTTTAPTAKLEINGAIRLIPSATPSSPLEGMIYYDKSNNRFMCYVKEITNDGNWIIIPKKCWSETYPPYELTIPLRIYNQTNRQLVLEINEE